MRHGIKGVLISLNEDYYLFTTRLNLDYTNNVIEYEARVLRLGMAIKRGIRTLQVYGDYALVTYQL